MMKYTKEYLAQLLERFMNGTSTLEEESVLANYFRHTAVPKEWAAYKKMFAYFDTGMPPVNMSRKRLLKPWLAAASIAILGILTFSLWPRPEQPPVAEVKKMTVQPPVKHETVKNTYEAVPVSRSLQSRPRPILSDGRKNSSGVHSPKGNPEVALKKLEAENAQLKAQLENVQKEIEQIREQLIISEMQARGYQAVYQEDGNIQFVGMSQGTLSVEL